MILSYIQYIQSKGESRELTTMTNRVVDYRVHGNDTDHQPLSAVDIRVHKEKSSAYGSRLRSLVAAARGYSINPILVTLPAVCGVCVDEETGVDLGSMIVSDFTEKGVSRAEKDKWGLLETYNNATREVAKELNVSLVDLAREMPKNSQHYYDYIHFTEGGTQKVGEILANNLLKIL
jgi:hypothetical protein